MHSPLVGPSTVRPLAAALEGEGWATTVPDLREAVESPVRFGVRAAESGDSVDVVIGHSGAGVVLPLVAERVRAGAVIFVDAVVPDPSDVFTPSQAFIDLVDRVPTTDGLLAPWHQWWPTEALIRLLPDESIRERVVADIPRVPRSFYDEPITLPSTWWTNPAAFLQLSAAYEEDRARAERMGWPTHRLAGQHLDLVTQPDLIAGLVIQLAAAISHT